MRRQCTGTTTVYHRQGGPVCRGYTPNANLAIWSTYDLQCTYRYVFLNSVYNLHTHTHPFNGPLSGTTRVSRYQKGKTNLDFTEARDSEWQWHQLGHMQVCTLLQTDNHASTPPLNLQLMELIHVGITELVVLVASVLYLLIQLDRNLRGPRVPLQQQLAAAIDRYLLLPACAWPQQQTRRPPLLLSIDGTDSRTDGQTDNTRQRPMVCAPAPSQLDGNRTLAASRWTSWLCHFRR